MSPRAFQKFIAVLALLVSFGAQAADLCKGRFMNPITDVCWGCFFPMKFGGLPLETGKDQDNEKSTEPACACTQWGEVPRVGLTFTLWEPHTIAEVVREPMCSPTLGGAQLGTLPVPAGTNSARSHKNGSAFYHVHTYEYPLITMLEMFKSVICLQGATYDIAWMSEFDLLWDDDQLSMIMNPEAILFANPIAQLACAADSARAAVKNFGFKELFWCSGSQGSLYPLSGTVAGHTGGVDSSLTLIHRYLFRQHRMGFLPDTSEYSKATCEAEPAPFMPKDIYKQQMVYPVPQTLHGFGFGVPSMVWSPGREFPIAGEDFAYLMWRKRKCCVW